MIPTEFDYVRAGTLDEAISLLAKNEDAKILAGGHSLIPAMKLRLARPKVVVDIGRIANLNYIREDHGRIAIGAMTTHAEVAANSAATSHAYRAAPHVESRARRTLRRSILCACR